MRVSYKTLTTMGYLMLIAGCAVLVYHKYDHYKKIKELENAKKPTNEID